MKPGPVVLLPFADKKMLCIFFSDSPAHFDTNIEGDTINNGNWNVIAVCLHNDVLPVPGGPCNNIASEPIDRIPLKNDDGTCNGNDIASSEPRKKKKREHRY